MLLSELETPAVVVDLEVMDRNLSRMAEYCRLQNLRLRPHTKSHKIPVLVKRHFESGAKGITVAKIGEAVEFGQLLVQRRKTLRSFNNR